MILYPKHYCKKITDINLEFLKQNNIKGLILDVDNTLIDYDLNLITGAKEWAKNIKSNGIKLVIVSNSHKKTKVEKVAKDLEIDYVYKAWKPLKRGLKKGKNVLDLPNENIATVGDQIFTDVIGGNRLKMFSILVEPIDTKDIWITKIKRPIENLVIEKYKKSLKK